MGIDTNAFAQKSQTSHGAERSREGFQDQSKSMGRQNMSMSGTFKITKRETFNIGTSNALVKSEHRMRRRQPQARSTGMMSGVGGPQVSREEALSHIDAMRQKNNNQLLAILEEEQQKEAEREAKLREVTDEAERKRLEKIFGIERARASERIVNTSTQHEIELTKEMRRLGLM